MPLLLRRLFLALIFFGLLSGTGAHAAMNHYADRGNTDFDTAIRYLNPYGTWSKIDDQWAYTPLDHQVPYTHGRWIYTEYGWYWKGSLPYNWVTDHYGYWKRGADKVWSWYPGPYWLPSIVEIRQTSGYIGWRSGAVDRDGNYIESPSDRYTKTDEWTFVTLAQFANPITPTVVAKPEIAAAQLEDSVDSRHIYITYHEMERPGPHPADIAPFDKDGGMLAPLTLQDQLDAQEAAAKKAAATVAVHTPGAATNAAPAGMTPPPADSQEALNARKVKYWITMSLPDLYAPIPPDAKPEEAYFYRPDFYQDDDGIRRRITLWLDPKMRTTAHQSLVELLGGSQAKGKTAKSGAAAPDASAAVPASPEPAKPRRSFESPLDESYHPSSLTQSPGGNATPNQSSKAPAPSGRIGDNGGPIPPPVGTNAAPVTAP